MPCVKRGDGRVDKPAPPWRLHPVPVQAVVSVVQPTAIIILRPSTALYDGLSYTQVTPSFSRMSNPAQSRSPGVEAFRQNRCGHRGHDPL